VFELLVVVVVPQMDFVLLENAFFRFSL